MYDVATVRAHKENGFGDAIPTIFDKPESIGVYLVVDSDDGSVMAWSPSVDHAAEMAKNLNRP